MVPAPQHISCLGQKVKIHLYMYIVQYTVQDEHGNYNISLYLALHYLLVLSGQIIDCSSFIKFLQTLINHFDTRAHDIN